MFCLRPSGSIYCSDSSVTLRLLAFRKNVLCQSHVRFSCCYRRSLGGIYHQVGILLSSCSCSSGHDFGLGLLLHLGVSVFFLCDAIMVFMFGMHE